MRWSHSLRLLPWLAALLVGCAHRPINPPVKEVPQKNGYYFQTHPRPNNSDELLIILAFSGGGTRAAAMAYGVLQELRDVSFQSEGQQRRVLDEVDAISGVSGGSFTAAAYGLFGDEIFTTFEPSFLKHNVQRVLVLKTLNPLRWPKLFSPNFGRSEFAEDYYDKILFQGKTFADLHQRPGPFIVINATDITTGARFDFTQQQFDYLCSDLGPVRVSRACAASSAVPAALSPVTLNNYGGTCGFVPPRWVTDPALQTNSRVRLRARELRSYLNSVERPYLHLVDGGVSDNLGLRAILDGVDYVRQTPEIQANFQVEKLQRVVVISANAYSSPERDWDQKSNPPGNIATAVAATSHTLDRFSFETLELMRNQFEGWQSQYSQDDKLKFYDVRINFTNFKDLNERRFYLNLPTSFFLASTDVDKLIDAGRRLLRQNPAYRKFLADIGAPVPPMPEPLPTQPEK